MSYGYAPIGIGIKGVCPNCRHSYDPSNAIPAFAAPIKRPSHALVFALCPDCTWEFDQGTDAERRAMRDNCIADLNTMSDEEAFAYTVTTSLSLHIHGEFYRAWYHGIDMPRQIFDMLSTAIEAGIVNEYTLLGGTVMPEANHGE